MKTGDKVRFVHSKGSGIIKSLIDEKTVEVEIEDGFRIPVLKREIVVIASEEASRFASTDNEQNTAVSTSGKTSGLYVAFVPFNDKIYSLYLINDSGYSILYTVHEKYTTQYKYLGSGMMPAGKSEKITEYKSADFEQWPEMTVQTLHYKDGLSVYIPPFEKNIRFKASTFYKSKKTSPVLNKEAFVYHLDNDQPNSPVKLDTEKLKQQFYTEKEADLNPMMNKPDPEIDLHIEKLRDDFKSMESGEILRYQLYYFEKQLENALAAGMDQIIFIHGTGNGILKTHIHKKLSQHPFIKHYEDARREKFGYGATLVKLK
jgi:hypothetical protein